MSWEFNIQNFDFFTISLMIIFIFKFRNLVIYQLCQDFLVLLINAMLSYKLRGYVVWLRFDASHDLFFLSTNIHRNLEGLRLITTWRGVFANVFVHLIHIWRVIPWNCGVSRLRHRQPLATLIQSRLFWEYSRSSQISFGRWMVLGSNRTQSIGNPLILRNIWLKSILFSHRLILFFILCEITFELLSFSVFVEIIPLAHPNQLLVDTLRGVRSKGYTFGLSKVLWVLMDHWFESSMLPLFFIVLIDDLLLPLLSYFFLS